MLLDQEINYTIYCNMHDKDFLNSKIFYIKEHILEDITNKSELITKYSNVNKLIRYSTQLGTLSDAVSQAVLVSNTNLQKEKHMLRLSTNELYRILSLKRVPSLEKKEYLLDLIIRHSINIGCLTQSKQANSL